MPLAGRCHGPLHPPHTLCTPLDGIVADIRVIGKGVVRNVTVHLITGSGSRRGVAAHLVTGKGPRVAVRSD